VFKMIPQKKIRHEYLLFLFRMLYLNYLKRILYCTALYSTYPVKSQMIFYSCSLFCQSTIDTYNGLDIRFIVSKKKKEKHGHYI